ncbi:MAG: methyl-accepting chemotaxis protein [Lachnospiraceae bacterium]
MKKNNKAKPINLKLQIVIGFIIPIFIVIFVGVSAYNKAETGLIETYETSTCTSIEMASQLIDFGLKNLTSTAIEISSNSDFLGYVAGTKSLDSVQSMNDLKSTLLMKQLSNDFIQNVHVIPNSSSICLSTAKINVFKGEDSYNDIRKEFESQCSAIESTKKWGSSHSELDNLFGLNTDDYAGFLCTVSSYKNTLILTDVSAKKITDILSEISLGENSVIAYQTQDGKEISIGSDAFTFSDKEYAQNAFSSEDISGRSYVKENGKEYLYMYSKCATNGAMISAIVPKSIITAEADSIRNTVIGYVVLACIIVGIIGMAILLGLQRNLKRITSGLVKASQGDLTVDLGLSGKSEFATLAKHVMETVRNTKTLISSVQNTTQDVSSSSENVGKVTDVISDSADAISDALEEINSGMSQEANDAEECLLKMDALSGKILRTSDKISEVESLAVSTQEMAQNGSRSMESLIAHSVETSQITATVNEKVDKLIEHSMQIEEFVKNINDIADQTTLLSLNASIEAARAGEMGRGFTVVAEEIKKLSENSMESAKAIEDLVSQIHIMTDDTKAATLKSQSIVEDQQTQVEATKQMFLDMNQMIEQLINNMNDAIQEISAMDADRADTLNAIQNISGVIEETLASTTLVSERIKEQVLIMEGLATATNQLNDNTNELNEAVGKFTV